MPKAVKLPKNKEFTFRPAGGGGGVSKYDWDGWFAPDPVKYPTGLIMIERSVYDGGGSLKEKRDYDVPTDSMLPKIKTAARRRYKVVQVSRLDADGNKLVDALILKGRDMMADERIEENRKRAAEKAEHEKSGTPEDTSDEAPSTLSATA